MERKITPSWGDQTKDKRLELGPKRERDNWRWVFQIKWLKTKQKEQMETLNNRDKK